MGKKGNGGFEAEGNKQRIPSEARPEHVYTNGLQVGMSNADVSIQLKLDGEQTHVVHLSYTLAKTLQQILHDTVSKFESAVDRKMLTTRDVDKAFQDLVGRESMTAIDPEGDGQ